LLGAAQIRHVFGPDYSAYKLTFCLLRVAWLQNKPAYYILCLSLSASL
jgi:hypothetical protein